MKITAYILYTLLLSYVVYFAQGFFYPTGSIISQTSLLIALLISIFYFIRIGISKINTPLTYVLTVFYTLHVIGFLFTIGSDYFEQSLEPFKGISISVLALFPFYYFTIRGYLTKKVLLVFFLAITLVSIPNFFWYETFETSSMNVEGFTNNKSYIFAVMAPFFLLFKKNRLVPGFLLILFSYLILISAKRGAILTWLLCIIIYLVYYFRTLDKRYRFTSILITLIIFGLLGYFTYNLISGNVYLLMRFQNTLEGDTSSRSNIYYGLINHWLESPPINFYFGSGFISTWQIAGNYAHNDWIELLTNFGVVGFLIYASVFFILFRLYSNKNWDLNEKLMVLIIGINWFVRSMISMGYTSLDNFLLTMLLGYLVGNLHLKALEENRPIPDSSDSDGF